MPSIEQITGSNPSVGAAVKASEKSPPKTVDYDAFLNLLVAQLKNQDPTDPTDPAAFVAQLASFSGVEQQLKTNEKLTALLQAGHLGQATDVLGRTVSSADGSSRGTVVSVKLTSDGLTARLDNGADISLGPGLIIE